MERKRVLYSDLDIKIRFGGLNINVLNINYEPPFPPWNIGNHCHSSYELHFIPAGKGRLKLTQSAYEITPGTFYLTGPGIYHEQSSDLQDPMTEYCINFELKQAADKHSTGGAYPEKEVKELAGVLSETRFWFGTDIFSTWELFQKIFDELDNKWVGYYMNIQSLVIQIIVNAVRCYTMQKKASYPFPLKTADDRRRSVIDGFFRQCRQNITPGMLSAELGLSVRQLNRVMEQYFSMPFKKKLITSRLELAQGLLTGSGMSVEAISENTGFSCASYFCKVFKEYCGVTPTAYRQEKSGTCNV